MLNNKFHFGKNNCPMPVL